MKKSKSELLKAIRESLKNFKLNEAAVHCNCRHTSGSPTRSLVCRDGSGIDNCKDCCDTKNFPGLPPDWESVDGKVRGATGDEPIEDMPTNQMMNEIKTPKYQHFINLKNKLKKR